MKNCFKILLSGIAALFCSGCDSYLDVVPEGVATIDNAFSNRATTQRYLYTCYSYLPNPVSVWDYPACFGGDEMWWDFDQIQDENGIYVAQGYQNANDPYQNYWDGSRGGKQLFQGMRSCNIFLENVHIPRDLNEYEKNRWIAEVKFIKAYLHFFLMQLYGPIPVMRENLPVSASPEEVRTYREPIDDVVSYIVQLIDEAMPYLPMDNNAMRVTEAGRITKPVALAIKARALVWAASPLFNGGNATLAGFKDNRGVVLIPDTPDPLKWERALTAVKNAIDTCHLAGHALYRYTSEMAGMSDTTKLKYALRYAITEKFNPEIVWPDTHNAYSLQVKCMPLCELPNYNNGANEWCATLKIAEQFYTSAGIPIDEDPAWDYEGRYGTRKGDANHRFYIGLNHTTAALNFDREPRFHAWLSFDRGVFEGAGRTEDNSFVLEMRQGETSGMRSKSEHNVCGYVIKKLVNPQSAFAANSNNFIAEPYSFPLVRLSDLYLLYAETLNETRGPSEETYKWIDLVRTRAGLKGVKESWAQSTKPDKPNTKEGLREIIKRERLIELSFEGQRFWDLRRWNDAMQYMNEPVRGWNYQKAQPEDYYKVTNVWTNRVFQPKDYLWPIKVSTLIVNTNLKQNPGWGTGDSQ